jgi:putative transposase
MPNYRRARSGRELLLHGQSAGAEANPARRPYRVLARGGRDDAGRNHPFTIDAFVVLPDHLHAVWTPPPGDCDFSTRWRLIKSRFAKALPKRDRLNA